MVGTLNFDTGVKEFTINGAATVRFNPGDVAFAEKLYNTFKELESKQGQFENEVEAIDIGDDGTQGDEMFAYAAKRDADMRGIIDELFEQPGLADAIFPGMNCYALSGGVPVWINFLMAVAETVRDAFAEVDTNPRAVEISAKNAELLAKYRARTTKR